MVADIKQLPRVPTDEMKEKAELARQLWMLNKIEDRTVAIYQAMYDAAPEPIAIEHWNDGSCITREHLKTWVVSDYASHTKAIRHTIERLMTYVENLSKHPENLYTSGECVKETGESLQVVLENTAEKVREIQRETKKAMQLDPVMMRTQIDGTLHSPVQPEFIDMADHLGEVYERGYNAGRIEAELRAVPFSPEPTKETAECGVSGPDYKELCMKEIEINHHMDTIDEMQALTTERDALKAELMEAVGLIQQAPVHVTKDGVWLNIRPDVKAKIGAAMFKIEGPEAEVVTHWKNRIDAFLSKHRDGQGEG
jgi:hypothetical protein